MNYRLIARFFGILLLVETAALLATALISWFYNDKNLIYFLASAAISFVAASASILLGRNANARPLIDQALTVQRQMIGILRYQHMAEQFR